ncbi:MAG: histidine--tRNA ligase [Patescibacteria group bacterium]|nr:histidine--tRNA ligase [Patescibacteria group bacterium]
MALSTQPYKGARDFFPEDKRLQKYLFSKLRQTVESFGYEEYDAPILEPLELYLAKSGEEIVNEQTYSFTDRGGREVVIRPEMTPTVSRMVAARRQELGYPLRWYSIPNLWRYERPQRGRLREHWQLNVDMFGVASNAAELEMITIVDAIYKNYDATPDMYTILLNSRPLINDVLLGFLALSEAQAHAVGKLIDRIHKMERNDFIAKVDAVLTPEQRAAEAVEKLLSVLDCQTTQDLPTEVKTKPSVVELEQVLTQLQASGIANARYDASLMRGFDYYTGIVFEVADTHPENNRSMMGGGRYDGLVGLFGVDPVPTVGFGLGDATLANFLELHGLLPALTVETDLYLTTVGEVDAGLVQALAARLRAAGCAVAVDISDRKLGDQLKTASKKGITYCLVVGPEELASQSYSLKNLETGDSQSVSEAELIKQLTKA